MNELPTAKSRDIPAIALEVVQEPMFLLLLVAGVIYFLLGDVSDALMLLGFVCMVMGITIYQERKTERVLEALRDISSPRGSARGPQVGSSRIRGRPAGGGFVNDPPACRKPSQCR